MVGIFIAATLAKLPGQLVARREKRYRLRLIDLEHRRVVFRRTGHFQGELLIFAESRTIRAVLSMVAGGKKPDSAVRKLLLVDGGPKFPPRLQDGLRFGLQRALRRP